MDIKDHMGGKLITLSRPFDTRGKALFTFYFLLAFISASIILRTLFQYEDLFSVEALLSLLMCGGLYLYAYRFINKAVLSEQLFVKPAEWQLIHRGLFRSEVKSFDADKISRLSFLKKPELETHPLAGQSFDYLGFQTEMKVINEMHGDNRLSFDYAGKRIVFGPEVYSWEFDELEALLYQMTGKDFRKEEKWEPELAPTDLP